MSPKKRKSKQSATDPRRSILLQEELEAARMQQQRMGRELRDTTAQELIGLGLLAVSILPELEENSPTEARVVAKMAEGLKRILSQVQVISRGLICVEQTLG